MSRLSRLRARLAFAGLALVIVTLPLAGCKEVEEGEASGYEPSKLEEAKGNRDFKQVTFTAEGAKRVGLQTARVRKHGNLEAPYEALIYDPEGKTYVYVVTEPLSFQRVGVKVERIEEGQVLLSDGPPAGTEVVTVGSHEVYGTELEIAEG